MARYHKHLQYHEDMTDKHPLTMEEIQFLMELQKEMNTQDHVSQADPRFWVIKGTEKEYGIESGYEDGADLTDAEGCCVVATDMESAVEYIRDNLLDEINEADGIQRSIELTPGLYHPSIQISWFNDDIDDYEEFDNMEKIAEWLNDNGYDFRVSNYRIVSKVYPDTMFLTQKAAENHLKANYYHYSEDAHTYAMTSWRNRETEMLWKILQQVDWELLLSNLKLSGQNGAEHADRPILSCGA